MEMERRILRQPANDGDNFTRDVRGQLVARAFAGQGIAEWDGKREQLGERAFLNKIRVGCCETGKRAVAVQARHWDPKTVESIVKERIHAPELEQKGGHILPRALWSATCFSVHKWANSPKSGRVSLNGPNSL
jgi:hypothetical protein